VKIRRKPTVSVGRSK